MSCIPEGAGSKDKCVKSSKVGKKILCWKKMWKKNHFNISRVDKDKTKVRNLRIIEWNTKRYFMENMIIIYAFVTYIYFINML